MPEFKKSTRAKSKYMVKTPSGRWIHFGDSSMEQYKDSTGLGLYSHKNHLNAKRRASYLARAKGIKKNGKPTWKDPESANYYSVKYLW